MFPEQPIPATTTLFSIAIPVAAGVFYPFFNVLMSPMLASAAMSLSSVCVIMNALRLKKIIL